MVKSFQKAVSSYFLWINIQFLSLLEHCLLINWNQFHSQTVPAISWPDGLQGYFLDGVFFEKDLWASITNKTLSAQEAIKIEIVNMYTVCFILWLITCLLIL